MFVSINAHITELLPRGLSTGVEIDCVAFGAVRLLRFAIVSSCKENMFASIVAYAREV